MGAIGRLIGLLIAGMVATGVAAAVAARNAKERIVRHEDPDADEVVVAAIFEPLAFRSRAQRFRGGTLDCWFGGGMVDLRQATLAPEGATLRVKAIFGGGQILVPGDWHVEMRVVGLGGIGDARPKVERPPEAPRLTIEGFALFGGFGVSSELPEDGERWMRRTRAEPETSAAMGMEGTPEGTPTV